MSTIAPTKTPTGNTRSFVVGWAALANGDAGEAIPFSQYTDKSVQVIGAFGAGGVLRFEGSNNGTDWAPLTDPQGNPLDFSSAKIEMVSEATAWVRPRVTAGDGTTSLTVLVLLKE
jgi:hypothetical protein